MSAAKDAQARDSNVNGGFERCSTFNKKGKENQSEGNDHGDGEEVTDDCVIVEIQAIESDGKLGMWEL